MTRQSVDCDEAKCRLKGGQGFISREGVQGLTGCRNGQDTKIQAKVLSQCSDWGLTTEWVSLIYGRKMGIYGVVSQDRSKGLSDK